MSFRETNRNLVKVWGSPSDVGRQGGRVTSRRGAGVPKETPLTSREQEIRKFDQELIAEEKAAAKAKDPRSRFEKKYDIRDGAAHLSTENFRGLIVSGDDVQRLKETVKVIHIHGINGLQVDFIFNDEEAFPLERYGQLDYLSPMDILQQGIGASIGEKSAKYLRSGNGKKNLNGVLINLCVPDPLVAHSQNVFHDSSDQRMRLISCGYQQERPETVNLKGERQTGNFQTLFKNAAALENELEASLADNKGIEVTGTQVTCTENGVIDVRCFKIGRLWHVGSDMVKDIPKDLLEKINYSISQRDTLIHTTGEGAEASSKAQREYIANFFNDKAGYLITYRNRFFAVLLREDGISGVNPFPPPP